MLLARHRRAHAAVKAGEASGDVNGLPTAAAWDRMHRKVNQSEAMNLAHAELVGDSLEDQFAALEKHDEVERLLADLKKGKESAQ